jgi:hypothetical protein
MLVISLKLLILKPIKSSHYTFVLLISIIRAARPKYFILLHFI